MQQDDSAQAVAAWKAYLATADWKEMTKGVTPIPNGCGQLYELKNPLNRTGESLAIADMRKLGVAEPHYHPAPYVELYFALEGTAKVVVGGTVRRLDAGESLVIPPNTAHFTIPYGLVLAVVSTPPFKPEAYKPLAQSNPAVGFDKTQFDQLRDE